MSILQKGVTAHTSLSNKEVAGVIDHADASVTDTKLSSGVGLGDGQMCKLPAAADGKFLGRSGGSWTAVDLGGNMVKVTVNPAPLGDAALPNPVVTTEVA